MYESRRLWVCACICVSIARSRRCRLFAWLLAAAALIHCVYERCAHCRCVTVRRRLPARRAARQVVFARLKYVYADMQICMSRCTPKDSTKVSVCVCVQRACLVNFSKKRTHTQFEYSLQHHRNHALSSHRGV